MGKEMAHPDLTDHDCLIHSIPFECSDEPTQLTDPDPMKAIRHCLYGRIRFLAYGDHRHHPPRRFCLTSGQYRERSGTSNDPDRVHFTYLTVNKQ